MKKNFLFFLALIGFIFLNFSTESFAKKPDPLLFLSFTDKKPNHCQLELIDWENLKDKDLEFKYKPLTKLVLLNRCPKDVWYLSNKKLFFVFEKEIFLYDIPKKETQKITLPKFYYKSSDKILEPNSLGQIQIITRRDLKQKEKTEFKNNQTKVFINSKKTLHRNEPQFLIQLSKKVLKDDRKILGQIKIDDYWVWQNQKWQKTKSVAQRVLSFHAFLFFEMYCGVKLSSVSDYEFLTRKKWGSCLKKDWQDFVQLIQNQHLSSESSLDKYWQLSRLFRSGWQKNYLPQKEDPTLLCFNKNQKTPALCVSRYFLFPNMDPKIGENYFWVTNDQKRNWLKVDGPVWPKGDYYLILPTSYQMQSKLIDQNDHKVYFKKENTLQAVWIDSSFKTIFNQLPSKIKFD